MAPPLNDNWLNATPISSNGGSVAASNSGATAQAGEPANNGHTVWWKFTPAFTGSVRFDTLYNSATWPISNPIATTLRAFTGAAVGALTEVSYIPGGIWNTNYGGWEIGSLIAFDVLAGATYYIRVDSVAGGLQGNFSLSWREPFETFTLGKCGVCPPTFGVGYTCVKSGPLSSISAGTPLKLDFGIIPLGKYLVEYCYGAFEAAWEFGNGGPWTIGNVGPINRSNGSIFFPMEIVLNYGSNVFAFPTWGGGLGVSNGGFASQANAEAANRCNFRSMVVVNHAGGDISLQVQVDQVDPGAASLLADGETNPVWGLYSITPLITATPICANWVTQGSAAFCNFNITNKNDVPWAVQVSLAATGGVSSSTPVSLTLAPNSTTVVGINFNCSNPNVTATVQLSSTENGFAGTIAIGTFFLGPVISVASSSPASSIGTCSAYENEVTLKNVGYWGYFGTETLNATAQANGFSANFYDSSCGSHASPYSYTIPNVALTCGGGTLSLFLTDLGTSGHNVGNVTLTLQDSGATVGTVTFPVRF